MRDLLELWIVYFVQLVDVCLLSNTSNEPSYIYSNAYDLFIVRSVVSDTC